jgi:hypothetical protein
MSDAPHPDGSICPTHGLDAMNIYQGGQHRNYSCTVDDCEFQTYRYPCPICANYEGGLAEDRCSTTPCPECTAKRTPCQQAAGIHHVPCEHFDGQGRPIVAVAMPYTNHNGERRERVFKPLQVWYGSTKWHPTPQWFMRVWDVEKQAERDYALFGFAPATEDTNG